MSENVPGVVHSKEYEDQTIERLTDLRHQNERLRSIAMTLVNHAAYAPGGLLLCRALMCNKPWPCPEWRAAAESLAAAQSADSRCARCEGRGQLTEGSVQDEFVIECPDCDGTGLAHFADDFGSWSHCAHESAEVVCRRCHRTLQR